MMLPARNAAYRAGMAGDLQGMSPATSSRLPLDFHVDRDVSPAHGDFRKKYLPPGRSTYALEFFETGTRVALRGLAYALVRPYPHACSANG